MNIMRYINHAKIVVTLLDGTIYCGTVFDTFVALDDSKLTGYISIVQDDNDTTSSEEYGKTSFPLTLISNFQVLPLFK
jgi:hypothetical protein